MIINIMAGGPEALLPNLNEYNGENAIWAGVDRGVHTLLKANITPNIAFGDFDSVTVEELTEIQKKVDEMKLYKPEKDETDLELALDWAIEQNPETIRIFGATGGRIDHLLANVQLLVNPLFEVKSTQILLIDRQNIIYIKGSGSYKIEKMPDKKYISFVPVSFNIKDLTLHGFKYPLNNRDISIGSTLCISNELISDYGTFSFSEGILLVIRSDD
jgi:thiamine pyrophosphokinase